MNAEILERKIRIVQDSLQNGALQWIYLATFNTNKKNSGRNPQWKKQPANATKDTIRTTRKTKTNPWQT